MFEACFEAWQVVSYCQQVTSTIKKDAFNEKQNHSSRFVRPEKRAISPRACCSCHASYRRRRTHRRRRCRSVSDFVISHCSRTFGWVGLGTLAWATVSSARTPISLAGLLRLPAAIHRHLSACHSQTFSRLGDCWFSGCFANFTSDICLAEPPYYGHDYSALRRNFQPVGNDSQWRLYAHQPADSQSFGIGRSIAGD